MPREIRELEDYLRLDASGLADSIFSCPECGREHRVPIGRIEIGSGLAKRLPDIACNILGRAPGRTAIIYDRAIEGIIRAALIDKLAGLELVELGLGAPGEHLEPEDALGDAAAENMDPGVDLIIGAGSGVIADLSKWIATKAKKPLILFGTAASMNAHASITATMTMQGIKTSVWLDPPRAVLFDLDVLADSPAPMRLAGLGDLAARAVCNADWKLAQIVRGKYFCPVPYRLTAASESRYMRAALKIGRADREAVGELGEAILLSGLSMTILAGETSPSSGCEHVFSHYWDLQAELEGAPRNLHGIQVGVGVALSFALWSHMRDIDIGQVEPRRLLSRRASFEALKAENRIKFGTMAPLFDEASRAKWITDGEFVPYIGGILDNWGKTWESLGPYLGDGAALTRSLKNAGFIFSLDTIRRTRKQALDALIYGGRYRSRYTMLDLARELGVLPGAAEEILDRSGLA